MQGIIGHVGSALAKLFRPGSQAARPRSPRPRQNIGASNEAAFLEKLTTILHSNGGAAQAGRINVIGLDRIKTKLGDRWDGLSERVHGIARSAIKRSLGPDDVWTDCGSGYVIAFGTLDIKEAQIKCRMIAQIIEQALVGEIDNEGVSVATTVATVNGDVLLRDLPSLDAMLARAPAFEPDLPGPPAQSAIHKQDGTIAGHAEGRPRQESDAAETNRRRFIRAGPVAEPSRPSGMTREHAVSLQARSSVQRKPSPTVESAVDTSTSETSSPPLFWDVPDANTVKTAPQEQDAQDQVIWEPMWDVRRQRIPIYRAKYSCRSKPQPEILDEDSQSRGDFALRDAVLDELSRCVDASRYILLGLTVRFWTIASYSKRQDYLEALSQRVSPTLRQLLLIFVSDVPDGVSTSRLVDFRRVLHPLCRELVFETSPQALDFATLARSRVSAVGTDLAFSAESERVLLLQIDRFAHGAFKAGITNLFLSGARSMPLVTAAIASGFGYISGNAVGSFDAEVSSVRPLSLDDVYRTNLEAQGLQWPAPPSDTAHTQAAAASASE